MGEEPAHDFVWDAGTVELAGRVVQVTADEVARAIGSVESILADAWRRMFFSDDGRGP